MYVCYLAWFDCPRIYTSLHYIRVMKVLKGYSFTIEFNPLAVLLSG